MGIINIWFADFSFWRLPVYFLHGQTDPVIHKHVTKFCDRGNDKHAERVGKGKNREIRKICEYFNWHIIKLIRIQYGKYKISNQKPGEIVEVKI